MRNIKAFFLLFIVSILLIVVGYLLGRHIGVFVAIFLIIPLLIQVYWYSDRFILEVYGAKPMSDREALYAIVRSLSEKAQLPMPTVYVIDNKASNVLAVGRNPSHASVAVTAGVLSLSEDEKKTIVAYALAQIKARETFLSSVVASIAGTISSLGSFSLWRFAAGGEKEYRSGYGRTILTPVSAFLVRMMIAPSRVTKADRDAVSLCGSTNGLATILSHPDAAFVTTADAFPMTAHVWAFNPLPSNETSASFSTFPNIEMRRSQLQTG